MLKNSPTEWLLASIAGPDRAAAILGDLTEMASTRDRAWFWTAYARTLLALTWRIPVALLFAVVCRELIFDLFHLYIRSTPASWRSTVNPSLLNSSGPLLACVMSTLWFVLPYAAVLYGVRDRFVRLAFAVTIGTTVAFLFMPWASILFAAATVLLAAAALLSKSWRKPLEALACTAAAGILTIAAVDSFRLHFHPLGQVQRAIAGNVWILAFQGSFLVLAVVCSRLHRVFLQQPPAGGSTPA